MDMITGAFGGDDEEETNEDGELVSVVEARREAEEKRREKHRQMEMEREDIRQNIRDKYKIPKKEPDFMMETSGQIGRKKKTPEELAAEANGKGDGGVGLPTNLSDVTSKLGEGPAAIASTVQEKCSLM
ncbi:complexin-like [Watersipora subatra]|uniref:complexin-like n=1 Tax=Watersipora subatra TaxID=2589382 RepID=UPI00355AF027